MRSEVVPGREPEVHAAGCVVWRRGPTGVEVLVVHRPRYDDWSLPKGKREPGETDEECARRELFEETGLTGELGPEVGQVHYTDHRGRAKQVRYWSVHVETAAFVPNDEVDDVRWLSPDAAATLLTYEHDRRFPALVG